MGSRLIYTIKNKNKYEKDERRRRRIEVDQLRREGLFRVALSNELGIIQACLDDPSVTSVVLEVNEDSMTDFGRAYGYEEMKDFKIAQVAATQFSFRSKELQL